MVLLLLFLLPLLTVVNSYKNPYYADGRTTMVHLFEWKWEDIAKECETFLGPKGFGGVQVSPVNENLVIWSQNRPWWERYQPISYKLETRSGNEEQFSDMVSRCNKVGVRIYVDAVVNHMTGTWKENVGTAGSTVNFEEFDYPGVPYTIEHFHYPPCVIYGSDYACCPKNVRNCELSGLKDLKQDMEFVREKIVDFMNKLIDYGVAGFRMDAAKHMEPSDLGVIYSRLHNLNTSQGFPNNARPYIYQEVIDWGNEVVKREEYTPYGAITEFIFGMRLSQAFRGHNDLHHFVNWGPDFGMVPDGDALVFIDNHDNQRGHGSGGSITTHKKPKEYKACIAFMLAHPYGKPQLMSSFAFENSEAGPPMDVDGNIESPVGEDCGDAWVCEHRWRQIYEMVELRNVAGDAALTNWWDNGSRQISFCRGNKAFIAFNVNEWILDSDLQTCLPPGSYCDVASGQKIEGSCTGKTIKVNDNGIAHIQLAPNEQEMMVAIHVGDRSRL